MKPAVSVVSTSLGRPVPACYNDRACSETVAKPNSLGLVVEGDSVAFTVPSLNAYAQSPFAKDSAASHLLGRRHWHTLSTLGGGTNMHGRITRGLQASQAISLFGRLSPFHWEVMLSSGGPGAGKFFSIVPFRPEHFINNLHFRMAILLRLGLCPFRRDQFAACHVLTQ